MDYVLRVVVLCAGAAKPLEYTDADPNWLSAVRFFAVSSWDQTIQYTGLNAVTLPFFVANAAFTSAAEQANYSKSLAREWKLPVAADYGFGFTAKGPANQQLHDVHFCFADEHKNPLYELVLGGWGNGQSVIRKVGGPNLLSVPCGVPPPAANGQNSHYFQLLIFPNGKIMVQGMCALLLLCVEY